MRKGCVAAFGCNDPGSGTEKLVVVAETRVSDSAARRRIQTSVTEAVARSVGIPPDDVVLVAAGTVPKTSSGKIQRSAIRSTYESGEPRDPLGEANLGAAGEGRRSSGRALGGQDGRPRRRRDTRNRSAPARLVRGGALRHAGTARPLARHGASSDCARRCNPKRLARGPLPRARRSFWGHRLDAGEPTGTAATRW